MYRKFLLYSNAEETPMRFHHVLTSYLEIDDDGENEDCGQQVHEVGQVLSVECLTQGTHFVLSSGQQMEKGNDGTLKLRTWEQKKQNELNFNSMIPWLISNWWWHIMKIRGGCQ